VVTAATVAAAVEVEVAAAATWVPVADLAAGCCGCSARLLACRVSLCRQF